MRGVRTDHAGYTVRPDLWPLGTDADYAPYGNVEAFWATWWAVGRGHLWSAQGGLEAQAGRLGMHLSGVAEAALMVPGAVQAQPDGHGPEWVWVEAP